MKKLFLVPFLFLSILNVIAQETEKEQEVEKHNELKINAFNLIAFEYIDISYEYILNEESSLGLGLLFALNNEVYGISDLRREFSITPYFRQFFGKKYSKGFFVERFGMLHSGKDDFYIENISDPFGFYEIRDYTDFALGISVGGKFVTKRGFVTEIYLGIGRDLLNNSDLEVVGRGGVSIGYRF